MNKEQATTWMVDNGLAENTFSAGSIWNGLQLWKHKEEDQKRLVLLYREWRQYVNDTKTCFNYARHGIKVPSYYKDAQ